jgi:DNA-binding transcriptional LysR family regulator
VARIDPRKLETFRVVVQARKISAAAKLLHLSQPAVTAQVRALEEECGRALLVRTSKGVTPNLWGLRLLDAAKQVREVLGAFEGALDEDAAVEGAVVLGASMTTAAYVVPSLVARYRAAHGPVPFQVQVGNTGRVLEWVSDGRVAAGLVEGRERSPRALLDRYLDDEVVAVAAPGEHARISRVADLVKAPLLWREPGSSTRALVEEALARAVGQRRVPRPDLLFGSNQSVKLAAAAGLGIAFLSRWSVQLEVAEGKVVVLPLRDLRIVRAFAWATQGPRVTGAAGRFLAWARRNPPPPP